MGKSHTETQSTNVCFGIILHSVKNGLYSQLMKQKCRMSFLLLQCRMSKIGNLPGAFHCQAYVGHCRFR